MVDRKEHWEGIYTHKHTADLSWYQPRPMLSLDLITRAEPNVAAHIVDAGSGTSMLIDALLDRGYQQITAVDISAAALAQSQTRLGPHAARVNWVVADVTQSQFPIQLPHPSVDVWHDRAVFHFLTRAPQR